MVSFDFIPAVQYMMYVIYIFHKLVIFLLNFTRSYYDLYVFIPYGQNFLVTVEACKVSENKRFRIVRILVFPVAASLNHFLCFLL